MPILDGLDELPASSRPIALMRVNEELHPGDRVVVSCRSAEYALATRNTNGLRSSVWGAAGIELEKLTPNVVGEYLRHSSGSEVGSRRWDPILVLLGTDHPIARAFSRPLIVSLARAVYNPAIRNYRQGASTPVELLDGNRFASVRAIERHLFEAFIPAAYRGDIGLQRSRWGPAAATKILAFLAGQLDRGHTNGIDICWWESPSAVPRWATVLTSAAVGTLGLAAVIAPFWILANLLGVDIGVYRLVLALVCGVLLITVGSCLRASQAVAPSRGMRWSRHKGRRGLLLASVLGLQVFLLTVLGLSQALHVALVLSIGVMQGLAVFAMFALFLGLEIVPTELDEVNSPRLGLVRDRRTFFALCLTVAAAVFVAVGMVLFISTGLTREVAMRHADGPAVIELYDSVEFVVTAERYLGGLALAAVAAVAIGAFVGGMRSAWGMFAVASLFLALSCKTPLRLMPFLSDAHLRSVLRQSGAVYQFRHYELQKHLQSLEADV